MIFIIMWPRMFLSSDKYPMQSDMNLKAEWTKKNLMKLNEAKCHYMIVSRSKTSFATRPEVNEQKMDQLNVGKLLGVWITEDLTCSRNCQEICRKVYSRISMITKLKYAGVPIEDLLNIYILQGDRWKLSKSIHLLLRLEKKPVN